MKLAAVLAGVAFGTSLLGAALDRNGPSFSDFRLALAPPPAPLPPPPAAPQKAPAQLTMLAARQPAPATMEKPPAVIAPPPLDDEAPVELTPAPDTAVNQPDWRSPGLPAREQAPAADPAASGYALLAEGDRAGAARAFELALALKPEARAAAQLGYLRQEAGDGPGARAAFAAAVALAGAPEEREGYAAALKPLTDRWRVSAYAVARPGARSQGGPGLAAIGGSQAQASLSYRPDLDAPGLAFGARVFSGWSGGGFDERQAAAGLVYAPQAVPGLTLAAERLIPAGGGRSAWLARAGYGWGRGYGPAPGDTGWWHASAFAEAAAIGARRRDVFASVEARAGRGQALGGGARLTGYAAVAAQGQWDGAAATLKEAGAGLWFAQDLNSVQLNLRLEYRFKIGGGAADRNGLMLVSGLDF